MTIERLDELPPGTELRADVCVIGSGAAGIAIARRLDGGPLRTLLLEAGGLQQSPETEADTYGVEHIGRPHREDMALRGRWFGGSTNLWFGRIALPDPIDFEARPWVANSGWPIDHDEVARWFATAASLLDVPHFEMMDVRQWPADPTIETFDSGGSRLAVWLWADGMYMGPAARRQLEASGNVRVVLDATATELRSDGAPASISAVTTVDSGGRAFPVVADTYVLATGGLENARLLLASTSRFTDGVGNHHDNVGRYYLDHPNFEGVGRIDLRGASERARRHVALLGDRTRREFGLAQLRVTFAPDLQREEGLLNNSAYFHDLAEAQLSSGYRAAQDLRRAAAQRQWPAWPALRRGLGSIARDSPRLAAHAVRVLTSRVVPAELVLVDQMEQEPDPTSRVTLHPSHRDRFGLPRLRLDWKVGEATFTSQRRMHELIRDTLRDVGVSSFRSSLLDGPDPDVDDMRHPSGTTRMSATPAAGVVDADCRVHGVDNLYVAGSSVFPTSGHFNPTLLIVALAARLADHLERRRTAPVAVG